MAMTMTMAMAMAPQVVPCGDFKKTTCLNRKRNICVTKTPTKSKTHARGLGGIDRTRREAFNAPNESSVAALGASLVTKQAGRVPQHD